MPEQFQKQKINRRLIIVLSIVIVILIGALAFAGFYFNSVQKAQNEILLQLHSDSVNKSNQTKAVLLSHQQELKRAKGVIVALAHNQKLLEENQGQKKGLSQMINQWTPLMAKITCKFEVDNPLDKKWLQIGISPETEYLSGSGFMMSLSNSITNTPYIAVVTNRHVLRGHNGFSSASECVVNNNGVSYLVHRKDIQDTLSTKKDAVEFDGSSYSLVPGLDAGFVVIDNPQKGLVQKVQHVSACTRIPEIGDEIVVLGFPVVGSDETITATEGIISGIEGDYFVTSAKIEHGNSGGAAFLVKDNCYFGIPTFVRSGELESLARILSITAFFGK